MHDGCKEGTTKKEPGGPLSIWVVWTMMAIGLVLVVVGYTLVYNGEFQ